MECVLADEHTSRPRVPGRMNEQAEQGGAPPPTLLQRLPGPRRCPRRTRRSLPRHARQWRSWARLGRDRGRQGLGPEGSPAAILGADFRPLQSWPERQDRTLVGISATPVPERRRLGRRYRKTDRTGTVRPWMPSHIGPETIPTTPVTSGRGTVARRPDLWSWNGRSPRLRWRFVPAPRAGDGIPSVRPSRPGDPGRTRGACALRGEEGETHPRSVCTTRRRGRDAPADGQVFVIRTPHGRNLLEARVGFGQRGGERSRGLRLCIPDSTKVCALPMRYGSHRDALLPASRF